MLKIDHLAGGAADINTSYIFLSVTLPARWSGKRP